MFKVAKEKESAANLEVEAENIPIFQKKKKIDDSVSRLLVGISCGTSSIRTVRKCVM